MLAYPLRRQLGYLLRRWLGPIRSPIYGVKRYISVSFHAAHSRRCQILAWNGNPWRRRTLQLQDMICAVQVKRTAAQDTYHLQVCVCSLEGITGSDFQPLSEPVSRLPTKKPPYLLVQTYLTAPGHLRAQWVLRCRLLVGHCTGSSAVTHFDLGDVRSSFDSRARFVAGCIVQLSKALCIVEPYCIIPVLLRQLFHSGLDGRWRSHSVLLFCQVCVYTCVYYIYIYIHYFILFPLVYLYDIHQYFSVYMEAIYVLLRWMRLQRSLHDVQDPIKPTHTWSYMPWL